MSCTLSWILFFGFWLLGLSLLNKKGKAAALMSFFLHSVSRFHMPQTATSRSHCRFDPLVTIAAPAGSGTSSLLLLGIKDFDRPTTAQSHDGCAETPEEMQDTVLCFGFFGPYSFFLFQSLLHNLFVQREGELLESQSGESQS